MSAFAAVCWPALANLTFEYRLADGSAVSSAFGITFRPTRSVNRAGCEYPFSQSSWPWSE